LNSIDLLKSELEQIKEAKAKYRQQEMWVWCSKLRDREKEIIAEIETLKRKTAS
jgi:hypothetical protein